MFRNVIDCYDWWTEHDIISRNNPTEILKTKEINNWSPFWKWNEGQHAKEISDINWDLKNDKNGFNTYRLVDCSAGISAFSSIGFGPKFSSITIACDAFIITPSGVDAKIFFDTQDRNFIYIGYYDVMRCLDRF